MRKTSETMAATGRSRRIRTAKTVTNAPRTRTRFIRRPDPERCLEAAFLTGLAADGMGVSVRFEDLDKRTGSRSECDEGECTGNRTYTDLIARMTLAEYCQRKVRSKNPRR